MCGRSLLVEITLSFVFPCKVHCVVFIYVKESAMLVLCDLPEFMV